MHVGLLGFPQAGKRTLLRLLTGVEAGPASPRLRSGRRSEARSAKEGGAMTQPAGAPLPGICPVRDPRVERLAAMYRPKKITPATIQYLLMPDMTKDSASNQELLTSLQLVDVLGLVVRAFADDTVFHLDGSVDPLRDLSTLMSELLLNDLLFIEKRLERLAKEQGKRAGADRAAEQALLTTLQAHLNENLPVRTLPLSVEQQRLLSGATLLTRKPALAILNVGDQDLQNQQLAQEVKRRWASHQVHVVQVSAKIEEELAQLGDPSERAAFLKSLGLAESAIDRLTRVSYDALGLIAYFTVGEDEVRAWTIRRGACAPEAGGVIHSDIEHGFIRAELIKYDDLIRLGSEQAVANAGKAHLKGKEYVVEDGDILNFRFNV